MDSHHPFHGQPAASPPNANPDNEVDLTLKLGLPSDGKETLSPDHDVQNVNPAPINISLANFHFTDLYGTQGVKAYGPSSGGGHINLNHPGLMVSPGMNTYSLTNQAGNVHAGFNPYAIVLRGGSGSCNHQVVQNWGAGAGRSQMPVAAAWPPAGMGNLLHGSMNSSGVGVQLMNQGIAGSLVGIIPAQAAANNYLNHPHTNFNNVVGLPATLINDLNPPGFPPARVVGIKAHQGDDESAEEGDDEEAKEGDEIDEGRNSDGETRRTCTHCNKNKTPMWRRGPFGPKTLCNACGIKYRKEQERKRAREAARQSNAQSSNAPSLC